eukprot:jgi/Phyca11/107305/e_gw1.13.625.1
MEAATPPDEEDDVLLHAELAAVEALIAVDTNCGEKRRKHYSYRTKREVLQKTEGMSERQAARSQGIPRWTISDWRKKKEEIFAFEVSEKTLSRAPGRPESVPFGMELITYMKDTRRDCLPLTARSMATLVRDSYSTWLLVYVKDKKDASTAYESLRRLLRRFAYRHGFVQRTPSGLKEKVDDLAAIQLAFAVRFNESFGSYPASAIYNTDETGIYYDTPPSKILSPKGKEAKISAQQKHSARMTAVCTIRGDGVKLPLLFIVRGAPNGTIEEQELPTYPKVQPTATCLHCAQSLNTQGTQ